MAGGVKFITYKKEVDYCGALSEVRWHVFDSLVHERGVLEQKVHKTFISNWKPERFYRKQAT